MRRSSKSDPRTRPWPEAMVTRCDRSTVLRCSGDVRHHETALEDAIAFHWVSRPRTGRGEHFQLNAAVMDLGSSPDRTPEIWVAAHISRAMHHVTLLHGVQSSSFYPGPTSNHRPPVLDLGKDRGDPPANQVCRNDDKCSHHQMLRHDRSRPRALRTRQVPAQQRQCKSPP